MEESAQRVHPAGLPDEKTCGSGRRGNSSDKDEDKTAPTSATVNKVQELLEKIEGKDKGGDDDDDEDIDVDDYINNLDKKAK